MKIDKRPVKQFTDLSRADIRLGVYQACVDSRDDHGEPNPINALQVISEYLRQGELPPPDLREWVVAGIDNFMEGGGNPPLGKCLGITGEGGKDVSANKRFRDNKRQIHRTMHKLICDYGISNRQAAARIAHAFYSENHKTPEEGTTKYLAEGYKKWTQTKNATLFERHLGSVSIEWLSQFTRFDINHKDKALIESKLELIKGG